MRDGRNFGVLKSGCGGSIKAILRLLGLTVIILIPVGTFGQESCCERDIMVAPIPMPAGQTAYNYSGLITDAFLSVFYELDALDDCPLPAEFLSYEGSMDLNRMIEAIGKACGAAADPQMQQIQADMHGMMSEYYFKGALTAANTVNIDGNLYGQFSLDMQLIDNCPGRNTVVKEGQTTWDGSNTTNAGVGGIFGSMADAAIRALAGEFMPLDDIIYDYERTPEACNVEPEKESVRPGEKITVNLTDIKDGQGRGSPSWQHVLVKVDEGKILNGHPQGDGEYHVFEVAGGSVEVKYQGPDNCPEEKKDTITVYNSCNTCPARVVNLIPDRDIASKEIKINCEDELEISRHMVCTFPAEKYYDDKWVTGRIPFYIEGNDAKSDGPVDLENNTSGSIAGGCSTTGSGPIEAELISGNLSTTSEGELILHMKIRETTYRYSFTEIIQCGNAQQVCNNPTEDIVIDYDLEMSFEDGYKLETKGTAGDKCPFTNTYILHLKN